MSRPRKGPEQTSSTDDVEEAFRNQMQAQQRIMLWEMTGRDGGSGGSNIDPNASSRTTIPPSASSSSVPRTQQQQSLGSFHLPAGGHAPSTNLSGERPFDTSFPGRVTEPAYHSAELMYSPTSELPSAMILGSHPWPQQSQQPPPLQHSHHHHVQQTRSQPQSQSEQQLLPLPPLQSTVSGSRFTSQPQQQQQQQNKQQKHSRPPSNLYPTSAYSGLVGFPGLPLSGPTTGVGYGISHVPPPSSASSSASSSTAWTAQSFPPSESDTMAQQLSPQQQQQLMNVMSHRQYGRSIDASASAVSPAKSATSTGMAASGSSGLYISAEEGWRKGMPSYGTAPIQPSGVTTQQRGSYSSGEGTSRSSSVSMTSQQQQQQQQLQHSQHSQKPLFYNSTIPPQGSIPPSSQAFFDPSTLSGMPIPPPNPPPETAYHLEPETQRRAATACNFCRARKLRCDGNAPCRQCARRDLQCVFSQSGATKRKKRGGDEGDDNDGDRSGSKDWSHSEPRRSSTHHQQQQQSEARRGSSASYDVRHSGNRHFSSQQQQEQQYQFPAISTTELSPMKYSLVPIRYPLSARMITNVDRQQGKMERSDDQHHFAFGSDFKHTFDSGFVRLVSLP